MLVRLLAIGLLLLTPTGARAQKWSPPSPEGSEPFGSHCWDVSNYGGVITRSRTNDIYLLLHPGSRPASEVAAFNVSWMTAAPQPSGNPSGEGGSIVYRGVDAHVYTLTLPDGTQTPDFVTNNFVVSDLTAVTNAPLAASDPSGRFAAGSGQVTGVLTAPTIAYRGVDQHLHVLYPQRGTWWSTDLTALTHAPTAIGTPMVHRRIDDTTAVYYRSTDGHVHETLKGTSWTAAADRDLTVLANAPVAVDDVSAYQRVCSLPSGQVCAYADKDAVVYRGPAGHVYELTRSQTSGRWVVYDLTALTNAPAASGRPIGYQRWYPLNKTEAFAVVFRDGSGHINELSLNTRGVNADGSTGWRLRDLTAASGAAVAAGDPTVFHSSAQFNNFIVYRGVDGRLYRIWNINFYLMDGAPHPWLADVAYDGVAIP